MNKCLLVLGGHSDIGGAIAHRFAKDGFDVTLAGRRPEELQTLVSDLEIRYGVSAFATKFDALEMESHHVFYTSLLRRPDVVVYTIGLLGNQETAEHSWRDASEIITSNFVGAVSILSIAANDLESRGQGTIIAISSVAGERGRKSNYIYGSAKSGLTTFLAGLRHRLARSGARVLTVKPGFLETKMTAGMPLPRLLTAAPSDLADAIFQAYVRGRSTIYYRPIWRPIMFFLRMVPEKIFIKTKL
ncbi:MAG: SDR family oxidoreductase [bacterium]|nr:SDR family oxidoreductase [bacterium]